MLNGNQSTASGISSLSELGINFQKNSTLASDNNKLSAALNNPDKNVAAFFTTQVESAGSFVSRLGSLIDNMICSDGLKTSLEKITSGALATRLDQLYDYMTVRLLTANIQNNLAIIEEVSRLPSELQETWISIGKQPIRKVNARTTANPAIKQITEAGAIA